MKSRVSRHLIRFLHILFDAPLRAMVRTTVRHEPSRRGLNRIYLRLTLSQRRFFHRQFAKIFRNKKENTVGGSWVVKFAGKKIFLPLEPAQLWLHWDLAISICGHDTEVKDSYERLIGSSTPPETFIDIGANYGTHSLLFLVHNIEALTFEPNESCHSVFNQLCDINGVKPRLERVALGEEDGKAQLQYVNTDTWSGSITMDAIGSVKDHGDMIAQNVTIKKLDHYTNYAKKDRTLIKIDVEGHELSVLKGGRDLIVQKKPIIIFESWKDSTDREGIMEFFICLGYRIVDLPLEKNFSNPSLEKHAFRQANATNFAALPDP